MANYPKRKYQKPAEHTPVPFDDALRKILSAPPQHKTAKKTKKDRKSGL
jgi:hypothetical protein